jgi:mannosyltransferase OCH1-like enzyme
MTLSAGIAVAVLILSFCLLLDSATSFTVTTTASTGRIPVRKYWAVLDENNSNNNDKRRSSDEDFSLDNIEYTGTVDWDAEWKKVSQDKDFLKNRPGSDFYKTEAEIAAIVRSWYIV